MTEKTGETENRRTERRKNGKTKKQKDRKTELFTCLIVDQACQDKQNGNLIQVPLHVQVSWWEARKFLHQYFHSRASGQGRGVCRNNGGRSWNRLLWQSHTPILLERQLAEAEVEHCSEFRLGLWIQA